jgi:hypothetical protein
MHHLIASYLFQYKNCPLPGFGTLFIKQGNAESDFLNKAIKGPQSSITFEAQENDASNLLDFIALKNSYTVMEAIDMLGQFCNNLKSATLLNKPVTLSGVGDFFTDNSGNINFKPKLLPLAFAQPVNAERVIHPQAEHQILVGDKETTNTLMTEYFSDVPVKKNRWWIWAILLLIIGLITVSIYLTDDKSLTQFGNAIKL